MDFVISKRTGDGRRRDEGMEGDDGEDMDPVESVRVTQALDLTNDLCRHGKLKDTQLRTRGAAPRRSPVQEQRGLKLKKRREMGACLGHGRAKL